MAAGVGHVLYLHGFASSPQSSKAARFERELAAHGIGCSCPDFNQPAFETLTVSRMLDQTRAAIAVAPPGAIGLIGSSLGAFVAVHAANDPAMRARIARLILLAPALDFGGNRLRQLGDHGIEEWRRTGKLQVFHYAHNEPRDVGFALYEDAARYDAFVVEPAMPTLVFQGTRDASVSPDMVRQWCAGRPSIDLRLLDDEHQLTASMDGIWAESARFLGFSS
ncbi:MAG TPA: YqiA/YcfP family alpha/beta fold hydrolase [Vicinamibacterales bacterium]|nr:YqiA/YcfP family alpha/beta fold hydrolase [Vicinamibacterales bacterium]